MISFVEKQEKGLADDTDDLSTGRRLLIFCLPPWTKRTAAVGPCLPLKCNQCTGRPFDCVESTQLCTLNQTSCMSQSFTYVENGTSTEWTYKGCSQGLRCNESVYVDMGYRKTYISSQCCISDMCNSGTYYARVPVAVLYCQTCQGNSASCASTNLTTIQCAGVQDRCITLSTVYNNVSSSDVVIKGCGTGNLCGRRLHYNTGGVKVYSEMSCCGYNKCNQGVNTVTVNTLVNTTLNGLQCYACNETGKGECTTPTTVSCTGSMTSCLDVLGYPRGNTLMRGCCSTDVCYGLSASMSLQASQKLYCCNGNLCNNGKITSYFSSGTTMARGRVYIIAGALLVLVELLRTLL
ncbi:PREDICTED: urokinase plasminogen activator surface receptor-like [Nanorana parkeri]|uniref:urokinase plasminogen activator surface receptor-like n=1 Tax=Nanorana parkeri TaxID=125878 RepID=UPI000854BB0C|nr:PREDICTED: urokinase plasminogen activator surface receptor-like [Nanorana parkeri]